MEKADTNFISTVGTVVHGSSSLPILDVIMHTPHLCSKVCPVLDHSFRDVSPFEFVTFSFVVNNRTNLFVSKS